MPEFKVRLKSLRTERHIMQKEVADTLEISARAYQHYETGTRYPDFKGLIALADFFNVSIDYLTGRTDNPEINK